MAPKTLRRICISDWRQITGDILEAVTTYGSESLVCAVAAGCLAPNIIAPFDCHPLPKVQDGASLAACRKTLPIALVARGAEEAD